MSQNKVTWNVFDREAEWQETFRYLPHRDQSNALTFVTFRLEDSMPKEILELWQSEIRDWLTRNGFASRSVDDVLESNSVPAETRRLLRKHRDRRWHDHLDTCHGECLLRQSSVAAEVAKSILHFDGQRYDVERFVIMPNHVHVLIQIKKGFDLRKQFREIQRYSARQINKLLGRSGELWQGEPFDHVVRSGEQFQYLQRYILDNPKKAKLPQGDYYFWCVN